MTRAFRRYPICHRLTIILTVAYLWGFALHGTKITTTQPTHNHPTWPPPPPLSTGNVVHAPPSSRGGKYCTMCAAARTKRQAVAAAPAPVMAVASACGPSPIMHPSGIILDVVGTAGTNCGCSCKEHACCSNILENDVLIKPRRKQILVPDAIAGGGKMKEETAITVNWVSDGIDHCRIGFLPRALLCRGAFGMGFYARWWRCSRRMIPPSFAMPSGIKTRGLRALLSSARLTCRSASALSQGKRTREWMEWGKRTGNIQ
jgi:hypothetical protein